ncbi:MAG: hypothetical protein ACYC0V_01660 [Armatimonadota bacterium]
MSERNNPFDNPALDLLQGVITQSELPVESREPEDVSQLEDEQIASKISDDIEVAAKKSRRQKQEPAPVTKPEPEPVIVQKVHRNGVVRLSLFMPADLMDQVDNACYWTPGLNKTKLVKKALEVELERRINANNGPFPPRPIIEEE